MIVALNFGKQPVTLPQTVSGRVLLSTYMDDATEAGVLRGNEGVVLQG